MYNFRLAYAAHDWQCGVSHEASRLVQSFLSIIHVKHKSFRDGHISYGYTQAHCCCSDGQWEGPLTWHMAQSHAPPRLCYWDTLLLLLFLSKGYLGHRSAVTHVSRPWPQGHTPQNNNMQCNPAIISQWEDNCPLSLSPNARGKPGEASNPCSCDKITV